MRLMKRFLVLGALCLLVVGGYAQDMEKFYKGMVGSSGTLYFVRPREMKRVSGSGVARKLSYDYTYGGRGDSVRLLFTLESRSVYRGDTLLIDSLALPLNMVYKEMDGKWWTNRMEGWLRYEDWVRVYSSEEPVVFSLGDGVSYSLSRRRWRRLQPYYRVFFEMMEVNGE